MPFDNKFNKIKIVNHFDNSYKNQVINKIYFFIINEPNLSFRSKKEISKRIDSNEVFCLYNKNQLIGFIFTTHLSDKLIEISGLYISPKFRNQGLSEFLLKKVTENNNYNYFAATFLKNIIKTLNNMGFIKTSFNELSLGEKIKFIGVRFKIHRIKEVFRHRKKNKLTLMKKEW
ncbi:MAG: GNAT family N-acetyltransferase [bacterium]|nr:GNAT family N-acetyltransferase [bacterium]